MRKRQRLSPKHNLDKVKQKNDFPAKKNRLIKVADRVKITLKSKTLASELNKQAKKCFN